MPVDDTHGLHELSGARLFLADGVSYTLQMGGASAYDPVAVLNHDGSYRIDLGRMAKCDPVQLDLYASQIFRALIARGLTEMTGAIEPKETEHG